MARPPPSPPTPRPVCARFPTTTSFSDREIVDPPARRRGVVVLDELRAERRTGRSARMLYEVLGDIWVVRRNPYLQDDLLDSPKRRALLIEALNHRLTEIGKRRSADLTEHRDDAGRERASRVEMSKPPRSVRSTSSPTNSRRWPTCAAARQGARPLHAEGQHPFRRAVARVARDRRDRRRRIPVRRADPIAKPRSPAHQGLLRFRPDRDPRGGGTGYTGGAVPLTPFSAVINTESSSNSARSS